MVLSAAPKRAADEPDPRRKALSEPQVYSVRVWSETISPERAEWRGKVSHLASGRYCYFRDWDTLLGFLTTTLEELRHAAEEMEEHTPPTPPWISR
jgi:hypothetical protein